MHRILLSFIPGFIHYINHCVTLKLLFYLYANPKPYDAVFNDTRKDPLKSLREKEKVFLTNILYVSHNIFCHFRATSPISNSLDCQHYQCFDFFPSARFQAESLSSDRTIYSLCSLPRILDIESSLHHYHLALS